MSSSRQSSGVWRRYSVVVDAVRTQLWPLPAIGVVLAVGLAVLLTRLDTTGAFPTALTDRLFGGGADAARSVLAAISGSLITVTSLTFSLTVVTLQLASSQYSPRLLRTFTRDGFVHVTLALFLATFVYSLTVLRAIRSDGPDQAEVVPQVAVTGAYVLTVASVLMLVFFLSHLVREIRVETMLSRVRAEAEDTIDRVLVARAADDDAQSDDAAPRIDDPDRSDDERWLSVLAGGSGFFTSVDEGALLDVATDVDAVLVLDQEPGSLLVEGTPIGRVRRASSGVLTAESRTRVQDMVVDAVSTGPERTAAQDVAYGLRQITDVASRALSPGVNDPTTAVHALGHSAALLAELLGRQLGAVTLRDQNGRARVILARPDFAALLELAVGAPLRYGRSDPDVLAELSRLLGQVGWCATRAADRDVLRAQLERLTATIAEQGFDGADNDRLARLREKALVTLSHPGSASPEG